VPEIRCITTPDAPLPAGHYSQATVHDGVVYVAGQLAIDPATGDKRLGSIEEQTDARLRNVEAILTAAGSGLRPPAQGDGLHLRHRALGGRERGVHPGSSAHTGPRASSCPPRTCTMASWSRSTPSRPSVTELAALPTPSLLLDAPRARRNAARVNGRVRALGVRLRPHVKTHKCLEVARLQLEGHAGGIMVSTLAEARVFAAAGIGDITYGVPVEPGKFASVAALVRDGVRLAVITDDAEVPPALARWRATAGVTMDVWVKVDVGYHRCGVDPEGPALLELAQRIGERTHLRFAGLLTHAGHAYHARGAEALAAVAAAGARRDGRGGRATARRWASRAGGERRLHPDADACGPSPRRGRGAGRQLHLLRRHAGDDRKRHARRLRALRARGGGPPRPRARHVWYWTRAGSR
jgi:hypothetical protein